MTDWPAPGPDRDFSVMIGAVAGAPRLLLRLEGAAAAAAATLLYHRLGGSWSWFALWFLAPDISIIGYVFGPRWGARLYNAAHSYIGPALLVLGAWATGHEAAILMAAIWVAHIGFDRLLGFGLKYQTGFGDTHLRWIGRTAQR